MTVDLFLAISFPLALTAWSLVFVWYVHPFLRSRPFEQAMRPILVLHLFRYIGLMFLIPGVTTEALDPRFALPAAYGDLIAALLALVALGALRVGHVWGVAAIWLFNLWGSADLLNAVARGLSFNADGALGATFWIPAMVVPLLLVTHVYVFVRLFKEAKRWGTATGTVLR